MSDGKPLKPPSQMAIKAPIEGDAADKRVYWRSRRGMAELEQQLLPFVVARYPQLPADQKLLYAQLLDHEDWDIFDWLQGRVQVPDPALRALVAQIIEFGIDGTGSEPVVGIGSNSTPPST